MHEYPFPINLYPLEHTYICKLLFDIYKNYPELATNENTPHEPLYQENFGCPRLLTPMNKKQFHSILEMYILIYMFTQYIFRRGIIMWNWMATQTLVSIFDGPKNAKFSMIQLIKRWKRHWIHHCYLYAVYNMTFMKAF